MYYYKVNRAIPNPKHTRYCQESEERWQLQWEQFG